MTNKKFTIAAIAAAAITAAPIAAPVIGAITTMPVMAADSSAVSAVTPVTGTVTTNVTTSVFYDLSVAPSLAYNVDPGVSFTVTGRATVNGVQYFVTNFGRYVAASDVDSSNVKDSVNTTTAVDTPANGTFSTGSTGNVAVYDNTGKATNQVIPANTNSVYVATATINGKNYYKVGDNQYVLTSDTYSSVAQTVTQGVFTVTASQTLVKSGDNSYVMNPDNSIKALAQGTTWKVFGQTTINGQTYYSLGGNQYALASDGSFSTKSAAKPSLPKPTKFTAVGKVSYVPGYGIQVWTQTHKAVQNPNGSNKKLAHGTSWKIFSQVLIGGEMYYNVGGNQWVDSDYVNIVK
ncbi:SLAP domain-containing protein [Lacticaseibacillus pabuli]|uniref:SLAP domain-containing protein n=1 Tax=Lacticaseibacillus pabuli TaxID=3025672 RepID=A0ABY7WQB3_9LACO|nr:SLAP domain-containing protein [Lacticaseibacillus sp. KACC 23028]WDF82377.1 SLAP domain-containing protein [Lacticaseibacillus sp. KACC 23028]